jgi:hypothetical protein
MASLPHQHSQAQADALPPCSEHAEIGVAGCVLSDAAYCLPILKREGIGSRHFYDKRLEAVVSTALDLAREGKPADPFLIIPRLESSNVGVDYSYIDSLRDSVPSAANLEYYLPDLKAAALRRSILQFSTKAARIATDGGASLDQLQEEAEQFQRFISKAGESDGLPPITTACEALSTEIPEPPEIISGLVHQGTKAALGGGSKSNKTWALMDCGISAAHGEPFWSMKTRKSKVLYANLELPEWSFQRRLKAVRDAKNIKESNLLEIWHLRGHVAPYDVILPKIRERIKQAGYALVILDPIYKIMGDLKENSAEDMTKLMNALEALSVECGCAIIFGAHFSKGNQSAKESMDRISGSGVFARDPDSILVMTRHEEENAFTIEATLRNMKPVEPFVVRWDFPLFRRDDSLDPSKLKQARSGRPNLYTPAMLIDSLGKRKLSSTEWLKRTAEATGIGRTKFFELLRQLQATKQISKDEKDRWFKASSESPETTY